MRSDESSSSSSSSSRASSKPRNVIPDLGFALLFSEAKSIKLFSRLIDLKSFACTGGFDKSVGVGVGVGKEGSSQVSVSALPERSRSSSERGLTVPSEDPWPVVSWKSNKALGFFLT